LKALAAVSVVALKSTEMAISASTEWISRTIR